MDIEEDRISGTTAPASSLAGIQDCAVPPVVEATVDGPLRSKGCPIFCMPSAGAIADAIIRRTIAEVRG